MALTRDHLRIRGVVLLIPALHNLDVGGACRADRTRTALAVGRGIKGHLEVVLKRVHNL